MQGWKVYALPAVAAALLLIYYVLVWLRPDVDDAAVQQDTKAAKPLPGARPSPEP